MPLEYRDVLDQYDALHGADESLPTWSTRMNELTGSELYSAGLHDNWIKRASVGIDRLLEKTGAPAATEALGRQIGGVFGQEEAGAAAGRAIPRMLVNLAPLAIPGGGIPLAAARFGLTAALSGAETYSQTDSPLAGVISGATFAGIPGATMAAEQLALRALGKPLLGGAVTNLAGEEVGRVAARRFAETRVEDLLAKATGQAGAFGTLAVSQPLQQLAAGQEVTSPLSAENLVSAGISQIPFTALHLGAGALGRTLGTYAPKPRSSDIEEMLRTSKARTDLRDEMQRREQQVPGEQMPDPEEVVPTISPQDQAETNRLISKIRGQQSAIAKDQSLSDEEKINQTNLLSTQEAELARTHEPTPDSIFGNKILDDEPRQEVLGRQLKGNANGTWRAILVSDDPMNPEELRGRVIGYSTKGEPPPVSGFQTQETGAQRFSLPDPQWWSVNKTAQEWSSKRPPRDVGFGVTGREPTQVPTGALLEAFPAQREMTPAELSDHLSELKLAADQAKAAQTSSDLQESANKVAGVQAENDMTPINDNKLKVTAERLVNAGVDEGEAPKLAVAVEAAKTENKIKAVTLREEERAVPLPTEREIGKIEEEMGKGGFSIIDASKLSHGESTDIAEQSMSDISSEAAFSAVRSRSVADAYAKWPGREEESTLAKDAQTFMDLTEKYGSVKGIDFDAAAKYLNDSYGTSGWDAQELADFANRPHVIEMSNAHDRTLTDMQRSNAAPVPPPVMRVVGKKGRLLAHEEVNKTVEEFSKDQDVTDAFAGSGQLAQFAKGAGAKTVTMNVRDPRMRAVFDEIKTNPDDFASRVEKAVEPINAPRDATPSMKDGSPITDYLNQLEQTDPNVGLFLKQNLNARGNEVVARGFYPGLSTTEAGLRDLPSRIKNFPSQVDNIVSDDGWAIVGRAGEGDRVTVDPPYVGDQTGRYAGGGPVTTEQRLGEYEQHLYPAADRGAKFVVFDVAHPELVKSLEDHGFTVDQVQRGGATQPELVAYNHEAPAARAPATTARAEPPVWIPEDPKDIALVDKIGINRGGRAMNQYLIDSNHPFFGPLGRDLAKFGDSLDRTFGSMRDIPGGAVTHMRRGGRSEIHISPAVLRESDYGVMFTVAHELVHGLTLSEYFNPTNELLAKGVNDFRESLIPKLPESVREGVKSAIDSGWYDKWDRGEVTWESLLPDGTNGERNLAYAMLNGEEFLSQGLTDHYTREFMRSVKTPKGTWYNQFTNFVKMLIGIHEAPYGTAFDEFLGRTDQLLQRGEYVSSFRNFANKYYQNLGMGDKFVNGYTQRAMAVILDGAETPELLLERLRFGTSSVRSPAWMKANKDLMDMWKTRPEDVRHTLDVFDEFGYQAQKEGFLDDFAHSLVLGEVPHEALDVLPVPVANYVTEVAKDFRDVLGSVRAAMTDENKGALNLAEDPVVKAPVNSTLTMLEALVGKARELENAQHVVEGTLAIAPDGYYDKAFSSPKVAIPSWASGESRETWWDKATRFGEPSTQWARRVPAIAEAVAKGRQLLSNARKMADAARLAFGTDLTTGQLDHKTVQATTKILGTPKLEKAADKWIYATQMEGKKTGKTLPLDRTNPEVQKALSGLTSKEQDQVETIMQQRLVSTQAMQSEVLEKMLQIGATRGAKIPLADGKKVSHATELAEGLLRAATADRNDPNAARQADIVIQNTQREMSPDAFLKLLNFTSNAADEWRTFKDFFADHPDWANGQRYGKYLLTFKDGKDVVLAGVNSEKEAKAMTGGKPYKLEPNRRDSDESAPMFGPGMEKMINRLREFQQNQINALRPFSTPDQLELMKKMSPVEAFATEQTYARGVPGLQPEPRGLTKGADRLPWLQNHFSWITKTSSHWSRQLLRAEGELALSDPEIAQNEVLRSRLEKHFDNMLQADPAVGKFLQRFTTTWFLGWNPASAIINGTQPFVTHVAELSAINGGKPFKSYASVMGAYKEVINHGITGKWSDPELKYALDRAAKEGELDLSMHDDTAAAQETLAINQKQAMERSKVQTTGQRLSTLAGNFSNVSLWMFRTVERINNMVGIISGMRHYKEFEPNLSLDERYAKAREYNASVNYGGGVAARPVGLYGTRGEAPRTASMLAGSMQNYVLGSTFQLARYIKAGYFRPAGLTPSEIHSARIAAVQMLATQLAAAGVLGLPFVSSGLAALDKAFPDLESNRHLREWMNQLLGEDGENGHVLTDIAMTGFPSMVGWDLQSRLTMGNTVPGVSEVNGFQPELLLGAPVNLISNFVKGGQKLASGDVEGLTTMAPSGLKKITQWLMDSGQVKDFRDRPIFTPTPTETAGMMLGFQPKRLSDYNSAQRIAQLAQDNITRRRGQFHQDMGQEVLNGNFGNVRQALQKQIREDKTYNAVEGVRAISRAAEEMTFPRDLRREGTLASSDVRNRLLQTFGLPVNQPSETDRLQFRHNVESRLGLPTTSSTDLRQAQLMDQLKLLNPNASRAELRRQVSLLSSGRRPRTLSLQQE